MGEATKVQAPAWFKLAAIAGLVWNLLGVAMYLAQAYGGDAMPMSPEQRQLQDSIPPWVMGAFAIAVFAGTIGAAGLMARKGWAKILLGASFVAALATELWTLFISDALQLMGNGAAVMPVVVIVVAAALLALASHAYTKRWID